MLSAGMGRSRTVKRILIASYSNVPEIIKLLDEKNYVLFVLFSDIFEIATIQKAMGRKRLVPILINIEKSKDVSEELIRSLPTMDSVINLSNSTTITKYYEKRKHYKTHELKFKTASAADVKNLLDSGNESCVINLIHETTIGLTHIFGSKGIDVPISTHLSTSLRNSVKKIFPGKKSTCVPFIDSEAPSTSSANPTDLPIPRNVSLLQVSKLQSQRSKSGENISTVPDADVNKTKKVRRSISLLRRKKSFRNDDSIGPQFNNPIDNARNAVWEKENTSIKKSMNKLHSESLQRLNKGLRKLNTTRMKKQKKAEKEIEEDMVKEKGRLDSKNSDLNATTMSRSSALTTETANRIITSRETRVNKEVCRNANKKKNVEFEKIEQLHNDKVLHLKAKNYEDVVKIQQECLNRTLKKYQEKLLEADKKSLQQRNETIV